MNNNSEFKEDPPRNAGEADAASSADTLLVNLEGYEGPIDVLLQLARDQKVDITRISILQLARQYLEFIDRARELRLELAADYLVMAAWLAYLKSRLLIPAEGGGEDPSAQEMAEALQFQLRRLEAMQSSAEKLMELPQLGQGFFQRGMPEDLKVVTDTVYKVTLYDVLKAYGDIHKRKDGGKYDLPKFSLMSMDQAMQRMSKMLGSLPKKGARSIWTTLQSMVPEGIADGLLSRSILASTFIAGLELAKQGKIEIRQDGAFKPVYIRANLEGLKEDE